MTIKQVKKQELKHYKSCKKLISECGICQAVESNDYNLPDVYD